MDSVNYFRLLANEGGYFEDYAAVLRNNAGRARLGLRVGVLGCASSLRGVA